MITVVGNMVATYKMRVRATRVSRRVFYGKEIKKTVGGEWWVIQRRMFKGINGSKPGTARAYLGLFSHGNTWKLKQKVKISTPSPTLLEPPSRHPKESSCHLLP